MTNNLRTLFLYISNAVACIPEEYQLRVFRDMAFQLHQWNNEPISALRKVLKEFNVEFNDICDYCGKEMVDAPDDQDLCSYACRVQECGCKGSETCCGDDTR